MSRIHTGIIVIAVFGSAYLCLRFAEKPSQTAVAITTLANPTVSVGENGTEVALKDPKLDIGSVEEKFDPTSPQANADRLSYQRAKVRILDKWQKIERLNIELVSEIAFERGDWTIMKLRPPTAEQVGELSNIVRDELKQFEAIPSSYRRIRETAFTYLTELTNFKRKNRFLVIINPKSDVMRSKFLEIDTDLETLPVSETTGQMPIPSGTLLREDADTGSEKSWAAKRYSHVVRSE